MVFGCLAVSTLCKPTALNAVHRDGRVNEGEVRRYWYQFISAYSGRVFGRRGDSDKLPAASGLATLFQAKLKNQYCAGLRMMPLIPLLMASCGKVLNLLAPGRIFKSFILMPTTRPILNGSIVPHRGLGLPSEAFKVLSNILPFYKILCPAYQHSHDVR